MESNLNQCLEYFYREFDKQLLGVQEDLIDDIITISKIHKIRKLPRIDLMDGKYIDSLLSEHIEDSPVYLNKITLHFTVNNKRCEIHFYGNKKDLRYISNNRNHWMFCVVIVRMLYEMSQRVKISHRFKNIDIDVFLTPFLKKLPVKGGTLDTYHINTGIIDRSSTSGKILIYRKEEWFKTLIHKCLHFFGTDLNTYQNTNNKNDLRNMFPINTTMNYEEAYVECWANMIQCMILSFSKVDNFSRFKSLVLEYLEEEIEFSLIQCNKILRYMYLHYNAIIDLPEHRNSSLSYIRDLTYKENTNVFCYYILNCVFLYHFPLFISWCIKENDEILFLTKDHQLSMLVEVLYHKKKFIDDLYIYVYRKVKTTSLRMTATNEIS